MTTIAIIDDHLLVATALKRLLEDEGGFEVVGVASNVSEGLALVERTQPRIVLLDLRFPGSRGVAEIPVFRARNPSGRIVVLTGSEESLRESALAHGADAFVTKDQASSMLAGTLRRLAGGEATPIEALTRREIQVAHAVASGESNAEAADSLSLSVNTVKTHLASAMRKLGTQTRVDLALRWRAALEQASREKE